MRRVIFTALAALVAAGIGAQESPVSDSYRIGPNDEIQVRVDELEDYEHELRVAEDGTVALPDIGTIEAQGLTADQLALRIRSRLESRGLRRATVEISLTAYRSRPVSILGAVGGPGNYYVARSSSLMEVLMKAGGLTVQAGSQVIVRRRADNDLSDEVRITIKDLIEAGNPRVNIPIFAGDLIHVVPATEVTIYFLGAVNSAGNQTFRSTDRVTLLTAIARAGGLAETASNKIRIKRRRPSGELSEIVVDFQRVLNGRVSDPELQDGDLIVVKESFF
ncbi:MAG: hypothetical protein GY719_10990 [bacterium]|nr:hypothetical protein [bacterium]